MLNPKQITIFGAFCKHPYRELTYSEIKEITKEKSNSVLQRAIAAFIQEDLLTKRSVGNNFLYKVKLTNTSALAYFDIYIQNKLSKAVKLSLRFVREELPTSFVTILVFGSYAEDRQTKDSDLDLAVIVNSFEEKNDCNLSLKAAANKSLLNIDWQVFTRKEMLEMLLAREENLGKQIAKKHLVILNASIFYSILDEGISHGFSIVS